MQDAMRMPQDMEKTIKENPIAALLGLLALAGMVEGITKGKMPAPDSKKPEPVAPAMTASMAEFKAIEDKARTDLYTLMDECFDDGSTVFFSDHPKGDIWSTDVDSKYEKRPHTVAIVRNVLDRESVGMSALNPPDEFSAVIGRAIALRRAMGKPVPKDYYTAGALLARVTVKPTAPGTTAVNAFKVGDMVKLTGKTMPPSTSASSVTPGNSFKITRIERDGESIQLDGKAFGWVNPVDLKHSPIVEAVSASRPTPETATTGALKIGDKVQFHGKGVIRTVKGFTRCTCGKPAVTLNEEPGTWHATSAIKVPDAPAEKWVKKEAQAGDTIRRLPGAVFAGDTLPHKVKSIGTCRCSARILILENSKDTPHPGNYEVLEVEKSTPAPVPEKWVRRTANVGDTIRVLMDRPEGAMPVKKGDRFKVKTSYGPHCIVTDGDGWHFADTSYEVLDV